MSMYPTVGGALINAFNPSLFDSYKSAGWQKLASALADKWPELDIPSPEHPNFDKDRLQRVDWATQAGMTTGILRNKLAPADFHILRMRYTHDGRDVIVGNCYLQLDMTDNMRQALVEGWSAVRRSLAGQGKVRQSLFSNRNQNKLQYMVLRALRPDVVEKAFEAKGEEAGKTIRNQQAEVKKAVNQFFELAKMQAEIILEEASLL